MPDFVYTARDLTGRKVTGKLAAASRVEALAVLDQKALFPLEVSLERTAARGGRRIKPQLIVGLFGQLADLLRSGVPLLRSIDVLRNQASHAGLKAVLGDLHEQVQQGRSLSEAMARHPKVFNEMAVSMVRAGAEGGFLEEVLDRVAEFTEQQEDLKSRVVGATIYPMVLVVIGSGIVSALLVFVVPKFEPLFDRMRAKGGLPAATEALLAVSHFLGQWWYVLLGLIIMVLVFLKLRLASEEGKRWLDYYKLRVPLAGQIFLNFAVARFCRVLGTLLKNGVPILRSLSISSDATGNKVLGQAIVDATENVSSGESLAAPLSACGHFPQAVVEMISVAEEANTLDTVLVDVADGLERRTWRQLDLIVRLLEPVMLLFIAAFVLVLAIALLMPVVNMGRAL